MNSDETFYFHGQQAWDGIGHEISNDLSTEDMLKRAHLDWEVVRHKQFYTDSNGSVRESPKDVLVRSDNPGIVLTEVPPDWKELQNYEAAEFLEPWVNEGRIKLRSAGSLANGRLVWFLAEVGDNWEIAGDRHANNLLFSIPHQYGKSIDIRQTPLRVACNNMIAFALSQRGHLTVRWDHRKKFDRDIVGRTIGLANHQFLQYKEVAKELMDSYYDQKSIEEYVKQLFPVTSHPSTTTDTKKEISTPARIILNNLETQPGFDLAPGTWWAAFNAITFCANHVFGRSRDRALMSLWRGAMREKIVRALDLAFEMATKD